MLWNVGRVALAVDLKLGGNELQLLLAIEARDVVRKGGGSMVGK